MWDFFHFYFAAKKYIEPHVRPIILREYSLSHFQYNFRIQLWIYFDEKISAEILKKKCLEQSQD